MCEEARLATRTLATLAVTAQVASVEPGGIAMLFLTALKVCRDLHCHTATTYMSISITVHVNVPEYIKLAS